MTEPISTLEGGLRTALHVDTGEKNMIKTKQNEDNNFGESKASEAVNPNQDTLVTSSEQHNFVKTPNQKVGCKT